MSYKIIETQDATIFQEYSNGVFFEIEFGNRRIKTKATETIFNPIEETIGYFEYQRKLESKILRHKI